MKYSFIIPVFNRPNEVDELLQSLTTQTLKDFDVLVVEDGSTLPCQDVVARYASQLAIHYYNKPNSGPGQTRNYGVQRATGEYVLILDSDVVLPLAIWPQSMPSSLPTHAMPLAGPTVPTRISAPHKKPSITP